MADCAPAGPGELGSGPKRWPRAGGVAGERVKDEWREAEIGVGWGFTNKWGVVTARGRGRKGRDG